MKKIKDKNGMDVWADDPIHEWFGLSYSNFLTIPRLVLESMPFEWQEKMVELLEKMDNTFDWRPKEGNYWVSRKNDKGEYCSLDLGDYRHGNIDHLRIPAMEQKLSKYTYE